LKIDKHFVILKQILFDEPKGRKRKRSHYSCIYGAYFGKGSLPQIDL
jgi:hypothetical protein